MVAPSARWSIAPQTEQVKIGRLETNRIIFNRELEDVEMLRIGYIRYCGVERKLRRTGCDENPQAEQIRGEFGNGSVACDFPPWPLAQFR